MSGFIADGLGPHAGFILASYAAVIIVLGGLTLAIWQDHRAQKRALAALERRGAGRRSDRAGT
jgi:heme exporter protein D